MITGQAQRTEYRSGIASIVVSVFVDILVEFDKCQTNIRREGPNNYSDTVRRGAFSNLTAVCMKSVEIQNHMQNFVSVCLFQLCSVIFVSLVKIKIIAEILHLG